MATDYIIADHQAWLGYLQPDGLVVSPAALSDSQVIVDRNAGPLQRQYLEHVETVDAGHGETIHQIRDLPSFLRDFMEWPTEALVAAAEGGIPDALTVPLPEFGETLVPDFALRALLADGAPEQWLLLIKEVAPDVDLDERTTPLESRWSASPAQRFERLLRDSRIPIGLISNRRVIRLIYAPRGENAGSLTFPVGAMGEVAGRLILSALHTLLGRFSLFNAPTEARLPALLARSRDYQARVSGELAEQVLDALYELLRGFQAANEKSKGVLLAPVLAGDPDQIYRGLLTTLMRLVFLLFAEDRGLMPLSGLYQRNYALHGLFERLRADAERFPDTMDQRYGAWAQLLAVFRVVHSGCRQAQMQMPARSGYLFDPNRFPFLEGYATEQEPRVLPLVADGVVYRVLHKLLILDGERLSYRTLDVEQIGSVYETMMGFRLQQVRGPSIALKPAKAHGAPAVIEIADLLAVKPKDRAKWLKEQADHTLPAAAAKELEAAQSSEAMLEALQKRIARNATPAPVPAGGLALQPTDARRRSGSHYTPRSLTEPIVRTTLEPVLEQLGPSPAPAQILELKVCDPAVGSGAFLVEACRQLAEHLVAAWHAHGELPTIPPDEDEVLLARRLVAQRCLYGVDRNPMAVDLAKLSLWLATLAKDHPFTFLDHSLRSGDSLIGLSRRQIEDMDWEQGVSMTFGQEELLRRIAAATARRREILSAGDYLPPLEKAQRLRAADEALEPVRETGDLVLAAFFAESKPKARRIKLATLRDLAGASFSSALFSQSPIEILQRLDAERATLRDGAMAIVPFHWEIEFPEVFGGQRPGFDVIVGNPPFVGGKQLAGAVGPLYGEYLKTTVDRSRGAADLVAYFFRRAFQLLATRGTMGFLATNSISETVNRLVGIDPILEDGGEIFEAATDFKWPGAAEVVVSRIIVSRSQLRRMAVLNGRLVERINSSLDDSLDLATAKRLVPPVSYSEGVKLFGNAFVLAGEEVAACLSDNPGLGMHLRVFVNGDVFNGTPTMDDGRRVIDFGELERHQILGSDSLLEWLCPKILNERAGQTRQIHESRPWLHWDKRTRFLASARRRSRIIGCVIVSSQFCFSFIDPKSLCTHGIKLFDDDRGSTFAILQSHVHEEWVRIASSSLGTTVRYSTSTSFDTFPFPPRQGLHHLCALGDQFHDQRARLARSSGCGLISIYQRFNDPSDRSSDIDSLRRRHSEIDRAVLDAYGWTDISAECDFVLERSSDDHSSGRRKKPWRYRWPDEVRDEVLARLLKLNGERAREEDLAGLRAGGKLRRPANADDTEDDAVFDDETDDQ